MIDLSKFSDDEIADLWPAMEAEFDRRGIGRSVSAEEAAKTQMALSEIVIGAAAGIMQGSLVASGSEDPDAEMGRMIDSIITSTGKPDTQEKCRILLVAAIEASAKNLRIEVIRK